MFIRVDKSGEIITIAQYDDPMTDDDIQVADTSVPDDFAKWNTYKYRFVNGAFVVRDGWVAPLEVETSAEEKEELIKRDLAKHNIYIPEEK